MFNSDDDKSPTLRSTSRWGSSSSDEETTTSKKYRRRSESGSSSSDGEDKFQAKRKPRSNSNSSVDEAVEQKLTVPDISDDESDNGKQKLEEEAVGPIGDSISFYF